MICSPMAKMAIVLSSLSPPFRQFAGYSILLVQIEDFEEAHHKLSQINKTNKSNKNWRMYELGPSECTIYFS